MDNLIDVYYLIQLIVRQILIFLRNFVFHEFTWFAPTEEDLDTTSSKIHAVAPQHPAADLFVFLVVCGLLFAFMMLSMNSPKSEESRYDISNIETISMTLEEDPSSFWYSTAELTNCFHACGDSIGPSCDTVPKMQNISRSVISNTRMLQRTESRISHCNTHSNHIKHSQKTRANRPVSQTMPREWLIRRTRSGQVYGKYPI
ncbi:PREDICTED: uncharacterized protein LOC108776138 isoform X1 [Cyphomyrmex costatus]|uniref:uncharacterized protein LOC108776138 isoform X1 n=1 Tax=Cyphomyrmex costatus TaxID=456900 RepID=UPI00085245AE|nr:PREDICTED: uncharacterized protein LOC108776138 isoform X1 [Cyphomyrmex costatus]